jgi:hypothetical protein
VRFLAWLSVVLVFLSTVLLPVSYLLVSAKLPQLESEYDLDSHLRGYIEGERASTHAGEAGLKEEHVAWPRPDIERLPRDLVNLFLSEMGCPTFFQTPRESNHQAAWRAFNAAVLNRSLPGVDGACELALSLRVADESRIKGSLPQAVAAFHIRNFLTKDQLVAYALGCYRAERGVFGVEESAQVLYRHPLGSLSLAQLAELMIAAPPASFYEDIKLCRNQLLIRQARDGILERADRTGLFSHARLLDAKRASVSCGKDLY